MPKVETDFKCLRCGYEYVDLYDKMQPEERACPECGSNSQRPLKKKKKKAKPAAESADKAAPPAEPKAEKTAAVGSGS